MANVVQVTEFEPGMQIDGEQAPAPPFTVAIMATSPIRLDQFSAEVSEAAGDIDVVLMSDGDAATASEEHPAYIWTEAEIGVDVLVETGEAHEPQEGWVPEGLTPPPTLASIRERAAQGMVLTPDEIQVTLRHFLTTLS